MSRDSTAHRRVPPSSARTGRVKRAALAILSVLLTWWLWPNQLGGATTLIVVRGNSMLPNLRHGDLVVARTQDLYRPGDIIVFAADVGGQSSHGPRIIHRIVSTGPGGYFVTQGDNRRAADTFTPSADDIIGQARWTIPRGGFVVWVLSRWWSLAIVGGVLVAMHVLNATNATQRAPQTLERFFRSTAPKKRPHHVHPIPGAPFEFAERRPPSTGSGGGKLADTRLQPPAAIMEYSVALTYLARFINTVEHAHPVPSRRPPTQTTGTRRANCAYRGWSGGPGQCGAEAASVEHDDGDEAGWVVEAVGVAADPADD